MRRIISRMCPSGNWHPKWVKTCSCCKGLGKTNVFIWYRGFWLPEAYAQQRMREDGNMLSWSGQLTTADLMWNGVKVGLIIGVVMLLVFWIALRSINPEIKQIQQDKLKKSKTAD